MEKPQSQTLLQQWKSTFNESIRSLVMVFLWFGLLALVGETQYNLYYVDEPGRAIIPGFLSFIGLVAILRLNRPSR